MGWLTNLLSRRPAADVQQVALLIARAVSRAKTLTEYRAEIVKAAEAGDLDGPWRTWAEANATARDFINNG